MPDVHPLFAGYTLIGILLVLALAVHVSVLGRQARASADALKHAESAARDAIVLAQTQARYRALFDSSPLSLWEEDFSDARRIMDGLKDDGVTDMRAYLTDNPGELRRVLDSIRVVDVNHTTLAMYGARDKADFFQGVSSFVHPDALPMLAEEFAALAHGSTRFRGELPSYLSDGRTIDLEVTVAVVPGAEETLDHILVTCVDITERKRIERRLALRGEELERLVRERTAELWRVNAELLDAVRAQEEFLSNIRHEMRTPLNSVIGFTGIVAEGLAGPIPEEAQRQLRMANRSGRQLLAVVNSALEYNEARAGDIELERASIDLAALLAAACDMVRPIAEAEGLELRCEWGALPSVESDAGRLEQIVLALLSNALKFTNDGVVSLTANHTESHIEIVVADTGPGIDPLQHVRVFEAFHQLQPDRSAKHAGTGLGLAIARELTQALGGELLLDSKPGDGSRFMIRLPIAHEPLTRAS